MLRFDGKFYLAYSDEVLRDSPQALLLKRAWEALRRDCEFRHDCQIVGSADLPKVEPLTAQLRRKWGVSRTDPNESFDKIVGEATIIKLDDSKTFDDVYRRLYGDSFYGPDRVVQCEQLDYLFNLINREEFERLSAIARGHLRYDAPLETLQRHVPEQSTIHLAIDVDENPIAILYKVEFIIRALREARVQAGKVEQLPKRIRQQLTTLERVLDADIVGDGRRDFGQDDEVFRVWDLRQGGMTDDEVAQLVWPVQYRKDGAVGDASNRTRIGQRLYDYNHRAEEWIDLFARLIKREDLALNRR